MIAIAYGLILVVSTTHASNISKSIKSLRIYNGVDVHPQRYPYAVALKPEIDEKFFVPRLCTGSLLHSSWVVTAAHCLTSIVKYVQYGNMSYPLVYTEAKSRVIKMIQHPRLFLPSYTNNIGLIHVDPVNVPMFGRLLAVDYFSLFGLPVEYAGYGMSYFPKRGVRNKMKRNIIDIRSPLKIGKAVVKTCTEPFTKNFICLSSKCSETQSIMPGDSGAPLLFENKIIGVASTFLEFQNEQIFTPISPFLSWIHKVISSESPSVNYDN